MRNDRIMQEGSTAVALAMVTPGYDQDPASGVADYASHQDQAQFEADKRAVYKHPLFPLLALLFERCEQATQSSDNSTAESFNMDIQAFVQHQERDRKPFLINDPEIDGLMIKAIQVLRIHLLELEKVQELCKDFCNRYITCLKGKMQSENLLRSDYGHHGGAGHDGLAPSSGSNGSSPLQVLSSTGNDVEPGANGLRVSDAGAGGRAEAPAENGAALLRLQHQQQHQQEEPLQLQHYSRPASVRSVSSGGAGQRSAAGSDFGGHETGDERLRSSPSPPPVHGSTPLSQIGPGHQPPVNDMYLGQDITVAGSPSSMQSEDDEDASSVAAAAGVGSLLGRKAKPKRGVLPKQATNIMRAWLFQHLVHPYPTEDEKRQIANDTNLTMLQVNNWFINARRRILQPMLDGAGAASDASQRLASPAAAIGPSLGLAKQPRPSKPRSSSSCSGSGKQLGSHQQPGDWQSDDSGSETNGSSEPEVPASYSGLSVEQRTIGEADDEEDSEDGGIDIEEQKPFGH